DDGQVRRVALWSSLEGERVIPLDVQLHALLARAGVRVAPLPDVQSVLINFRGGPGGHTYPWVSYYRVVRGEIPREFWKDNVALGAFAVLDVWLQAMAATVALVLGYGGTVTEHFVREQRERRQLSRFFSPAVVREVVRLKDEGSLTTSRRLVTVLFSDIRGFTSLSEQLQPEQVEEMLREYLTEMTEIVYKHKGVVDKYIGDCVMALYNAPFDDR